MIDKPPFKEIPDELTQLKYLKKLNLPGLKIKSVPANFTELKNLEYLDISMNKLDIAKELPTLRSLPNLKVLSILGNRIDSIKINYWKVQNPEIEIIF